MSVPQVPQGSSSGTPRAINVPLVVLLLTGTCVVIELVRAYFLSAQNELWLLYWFAFIPARYADPQLALSWQAFTSPFTYSVLHGGFGHLLSNCLWLAVFGSPLAVTIGARRFLLFWLFCSGMGALFHYLAQPEDFTPMIGASGAVSGMMGAAARFGFQMVRTRNEASCYAVPAPPMASLIKMPGVIVFLGVYLVMNLGIGAFDATVSGVGIAWQAHLGGILAGFVAAPYLIRRGS